MSATETSAASDGRIMPAKPAETNEHKYARQTRTAVVVIAWIVSVMTALSLITAIVVMVQLNKASDQLSGGGIYNCQSLGGTDPSC
jgi:hypothetical protein